MFEEFGDILTVEETCEALRIGRNGLYALLHSGQLKSFRNAESGAYLAHKAAKTCQTILK